MSVPFIASHCTALSKAEERPSDPGFSSGTFGSESVRTGLDIYFFFSEINPHRSYIRAQIMDPDLAESANRRSGLWPETYQEFQRLFNREIRVGRYCNMSI